MSGKRKMKKIIIVNNNMKVGGVQKSLYNLLWSISDQYDITLCLFSKTGEYVDQLPENVRVMAVHSLFRFFGVSQKECENRIPDRLERGLLAVLCRIFGRPFVLWLAALSQKKLPEKYDVAISYLQNGRFRTLYGGTNEFVLGKIRAREKIALLHCDYCNCGADIPSNNKLYYRFDRIAACSDGCRRSFVKTIPDLADRCVTVRNFHRQERIREMAWEKPVKYKNGAFHLVIVGRLAHEKAVDRAIRAVAYGMEKGLTICLHIVGDGNRMSPLRALADSPDIRENIFFYGEQSNPYRFMTNADLLLVTSYHEAAPLVVDEAYILGLPVLTVETTSSREMVSARHCGWVCGNSQHELNECLVNVLSHPEELENMKRTLKKNRSDNSEAAHQFRNVIGE